MPSGSSGGGSTPAETARRVPAGRRARPHRPVLIAAGGRRGRGQAADRFGLNPSTLRNRACASAGIRRPGLSKAPGRPRVHGETFAHPPVDRARFGQIWGSLGTSAAPGHDLPGRTMARRCSSGAEGSTPGRAHTQPTLLYAKAFVAVQCGDRPLTRDHHGRVEHLSDGRARGSRRATSARVDHGDARRRDRSDDA